MSFSACFPLFEKTAEGQKGVKRAKNVARLVSKAACERDTEAPSVLRLAGNSIDPLLFGAKIYRKNGGNHTSYVKETDTFFTSTNNKNAVPAAGTLVRRIGNTTYKVRVFFNEASKETMTDKIVRMIRNTDFQNTFDRGIIPVPQTSPQSERSTAYGNTD